MKKIALALLLCLVPAANADDKAEIADVLDSLHELASTASWSDYFALFTKDAHFIGTDASEHWKIGELREYSKGAKNGWTYHPVERDINLSPELNVAWFHEILDSEKYGTSRGTGVLIRTGSGWKISQYHLTYPMPNDLTVKFTDEIKGWEAAQK